jgi:hypothetical protein
MSSGERRGTAAPEDSNAFGTAYRLGDDRPAAADTVMNPVLC